MDQQKEFWKVVKQKQKNKKNQLLKFQNGLNKPFLTMKKSILKRRKVCIFPKRLDHGFCQKFKTFSLFYFNAK